MWKTHYGFLLHLYFIAMKCYKIQFCKCKDSILLLTYFIALCTKNTGVLTIIFIFHSTIVCNSYNAKLIHRMYIKIDMLSFDNTVKFKNAETNV